LRWRRRLVVGFFAAALWLAIGASGAAAAEPSPVDLALAVDAVWVLLAGVLVIFMQAGFALLEAGLTRTKNAAHIAGKNLIVLAVASLAFWAFGFGVAFGAGNPLFGTSGFFLNAPPEDVATVFPSLAASAVPISAKYIFQVAFCAVSLAIVWGGMAERTRLVVYPLFGLIYTTVIYPVTAHWIWGGGWLAGLGMQDFAGSTVVHLQGGTAALVGAWLLGPRLGRYGPDGRPNPIPGHNLTYAVLGTFILWLGWFGFNPGSTLAAVGAFFAYVALTTHLAAAAGALSGLFGAWVFFGKPDIGMMLNGVLAALVAITASCAYVEPWAAVVIGAVAGLVMLGTVRLVEARLKVDDPVGAFGVHGAAGVWGTLSTGLFASPDLVRQLGVGQPGLLYGGGVTQLGVQALGIVTAFAYVAAASFITLYVIKRVVGLRVRPEDELMGLDLAEHGAEGYPELARGQLKPPSEVVVLRSSGLG
jgi:Amt family ammonium transporter